ncbi:ABC transporter substrate-binding protein [Piscinibacter sakaiensis]|uniref:Arginine/ornithine ABC transporter, periplasmic arginine/ornithine binding protein n=1 Tax=Piscinibacter sakaiensis TaxID=1547922 RepID=A0A0K8NZW3_PISS1|nr:ABC transporter substrate-binding protein [Piscinibacter sakaiensis]GAP35918.1 arginine/ornithine ABC transporter, periplasmic arginine/ornithine binding protein [Piscinibacter sakaiensis]
MFALSLLARRLARSAWPLLLGLAAGLCAAADPKPLRIGIEGAYPPFSSVAPDGTVRGFDIDIADAVCAELRRACTKLTLDFDGMIPALQARKIDLVVASMAISPERLKVVDFSDKYYNTPARFVARRDAGLQPTPQGLAGRTIGVQRGTVHERYAAARFTASRIVRYAKQDEVFLDLAAGRLDGTLCDSVAADQGFLKTPAGRAHAFVGPAFDDPAFFGSGAGIAMRKGDPLREAVNAALRTLRANGSYQRLQARYFDFDIYGR